MTTLTQTRTDTKDVLPISRSRNGTRVQSSSSLDNILALFPEASELPHPFVTPEWLETWLSVFAPDQDLECQLPSNTGGPTAYLPLLRSPLRFYGLQLDCWHSPWNPHTPRFDIIGGGTPEVIDLVAKDLCERASSCDLILLRQLPTSGEALQHLRNALEAGGLGTEIWESSRSPFIRTDGNYEEYLSTLKSKHLSNIRNRFRRLELGATPSLEIIDGRTGMEEALAEGFYIEGAAWKDDAGTAILSSEQVTRFYRQLAGRMVDRGWLRLCFLRADHRRIAFAYSLKFGRRLYLLKTGYDPLYQSYSPMNLLMKLLVDSCFEDDTIEIDFLGDAAPWKMEWTEQVRTHVWLYLFSNSWRARVVRRLKFTAVPRVRRLVSQLRKATALATDRGNSIPSSGKPLQ